MKRMLVALVAACALAAVPRLEALTEAELLGSWELTGYLAIRETTEGSYQLVLGDEQRSPEYILLRRATFYRNAACALLLSLPSGEEQVQGQFRKVTVDGQEYLTLRWGDEEVAMTIRPIMPDNLTTLFFVATTRGQGRYAAYTYDTFGSMEKVTD